MRVIINADDFGYSEKVTRAILESLERGYITQTTLMVNMPYADQAVALAKSKGMSGRIGLHLNIGEGYPLTESIKSCRAFCDSDGCFNGGFRSRRILPLVYKLSSSERRSLREEIKAQIDKYLSYDLPLMHIDGHYHNHTCVPIFREASGLIRKAGFKSVRKPNSICWFSQRGIALRLQTAWMKFLLTGANVKMVDYFGGIGIFRQNASLIPSDSTVELMVHPQYDDGRLIDKDARKPMACDTLESIWRFVSSCGAEFITYLDV